MCRSQSDLNLAVFHHMLSSAATASAGVAFLARLTTEAEGPSVDIDMFDELDALGSRPNELSKRSVLRFDIVAHPAPLRALHAVVLVLLLLWAQMGVCGRQLVRVRVCCSSLCFRWS